MKFSNYVNKIMGMDRKLSYIRSCDIYSMAADVIYLSIFSVSYV